MKPMRISESEPIIATICGQSLSKAKSRGSKLALLALGPGPLGRPMEPVVPSCGTVAWSFLPAQSLLVSHGFVR
eukprot:9592261-Alexandrium_andersonii.AAC.1